MGWDENRCQTDSVMLLSAMRLEPNELETHVKTNCFLQSTHYSVDSSIDTDSSHPPDEIKGKGIVLLISFWNFRYGSAWSERAARTFFEFIELCCIRQSYAHSTLRRIELHHQGKLYLILCVFL